MFNPWAGKIAWRREQLPTPVFWPEEFHDGNRHQRLQLITLPLGHLLGNGQDAEAEGAKGCACVDRMGWAGKGKIPQRAQPQSTAAVQGSSGAAHLPVSPPVRSPARWGSMAGSPLRLGTPISYANVSPRIHI